MGILKSNYAIKASDTYLSESFNKRSLFKKRDIFSVQYIDKNLNVCKITKLTELYDLILPAFESLADIKRAGIVKEFYRNDTNLKYSAQDFNLRDALLFLEEFQDKLNLIVTKINFNSKVVYQIDMNRYELKEENNNKELELLKKENRILKRNLNLSNEYMLQARIQSAILFSELVDKSSKMKELKSNHVGQEEEEEI